MSLVPNERIKLTAGLLNTVAGFALTAGGLGPLIALSFGLTTSSPLSNLALGLIIAIWMIVGLSFHWIARRLLGNLRS